jgi:hypothetical protein
MILYDGRLEDRVMEALDLAFRLATACRSHSYPLVLNTVADAAGYGHLSGLREADELNRRFEAGSDIPPLASQCRLLTQNGPR